VCTWKEVCNLLNRILCRRHVAARWEGWIWGKTRSMVDSGGLSVPCMVSSIIISHHQTGITAYYTPHASLTILAPTRCQYRTRVYPRQRLLRIPSGGHVRYKRVNTVTGILFQTANNFHHAFPGMILISHEITSVSKNTSVLQSSQNNTQQILN